MELILIIVVLLLLFGGGGGYFGRSRVIGDRRVASASMLFALCYSHYAIRIRRDRGGRALPRPTRRMTSEIMLCRSAPSCSLFW
jgi:hypothetical protein